MGDRFDRDFLLDLHRKLLFPRLIEEKMLNLLRQGRLSKWFSGIGQEAIAVGVTASLREDDYVLPMHRNLGVFTTRGLDLPKLFCQLMGRGEGFTKGRDRSFHFGTLDHHIVGMISHLGAMLPVADGLGLASQLRGGDQVAVAFTGDGATSEGDFHEAVNLAAVWKLPVVFVIENNQYGLSTPTSEQYACKRLADKAIGYGIPGVFADGNDVLAVMTAMDEALARARRGDGPTLIEFETFRMRGHEEASGTAYVPAHLFEEWAKKDPILRFEAALKERDLWDEERVAALRRELRATIEAAVDAALEAPPPPLDPARELGDVFAPALPPRAPAGAEEELRYVDAMSQGLREAMDHDDKVLILGQDIAEYGGAFKVTAGFVERFGKGRVRNTPIIESGAIGCAMGLALEGFKPVVEMQFGDFVTCGFNQIVNNLAKNNYRWEEPVNVTVRMPIGGGVGAGPYHSQSPESWFTCVAGLKVVAPASPADAKGLLIASIEDPNPVIFLEHKLLYRSVKGQVPQGYYRGELGRAAVARPGRDLTVVSWSAGVWWAVEAAEALAAEGVEVEVIDLRTLVPLDMETVAASVRKTGRALVLHEAPITGGFGGEIAARIGRDCFEYLDAPVERLAALDTPVPFSKELEVQFMPKARLLPALRALLAY